MSDLILYSEACRALQAAVETDEVREIRDKSEAMRIYAKQSKNKELELNAAEIRFRAERRLGELIKLQKETVGLNRGGWTERKAKSCPSDEVAQDRPPTLAEAGIDWKLSSRATKMAHVPEDEFEGMIADWRENVEQENTRVTTNLLAVGEANQKKAGSVVGLYTGEDEWYTPEKYIESVRGCLGEIDLDPASNNVANKTVKAKKYYSRLDDGLTKKWVGTVFLNPPYKQPLVSNFTEKLVAEYKAGNVTSAVLLTNNSTDTKWWHKCVTNCSAACFTAGRINFYRDKEYNAPTNGQVFLYFGDYIDDFSEHFEQHGWITTPYIRM